MRWDPLHLAVQSGPSWPCVAVVDALVKQVPVESGLELGAIVGLGLLDPERQSGQVVVHERDRGLLIVLVVDPHHAQPGAVVDRGVLVTRLAPPFGRGHGFDELHVDLKGVAGPLFLVPLPLRGRALVPLGGREAIHVQALEDPPDPRCADLDVVVELEIHLDLVRYEVVVLAQVHDLPHEFIRGGVWSPVGSAGAVCQGVQAALVVATPSKCRRRSPSALPDIRKGIRVKAS